MQLTFDDVPAGPRVEVVRSAKRRKTVSAREVEGVIRVSIPASMTRAEETRWVDEMVRRLTRKATSEEVDLEERAARLAARYGLPRPASIRWVGNQGSRWGSCTPADRTVRISDRMADFPPWVLDYVIVHELAHLVVAAHDDRFHALVARYPKAERAVGFLIAKGMDDG
ncbi:MAG TPA: M48 family metallopeptidase [Acidimicrobiales bacterium]|nr:M48 family metallopeptidase [Acidimicrobiales bacterium]